MSCKLVVKLLVIVFLSELAYGACPSPYTHQFGTKCYFFRDSLANLKENVELCKKFKGTLVSVGSKEENQFLANLLTQEQVYWIGLERPTVGLAKFTWMDGSPVNYTNWAYREPHDLSRKHWGARISTYGYGLWFDYFATDYIYQLCQYVKVESKEVKRITPSFGKLVDRLNTQELLVRDLTELVKRLIGQVTYLKSTVTRNITIALAKISSIEHRMSTLETSNRASTMHPRT